VPPPPGLRGDAPFIAEWRGGDVPPPPPDQVVEWRTAVTPPPAPSGSGLRAQLDELQRVRAQLVDVADRLVTELALAVGELEGAAAEPMLEGRVVVEVGRFGDIASLGAFEQALQRTPGVRAVSVRTLEDGHARIDVDLERPTALVAELGATAPLPFEVSAVGDGRLVLALTLAG
jgi:hypothetical protein